MGTQTIQVTITDDPAESGKLISTLFASGTAPALTETGDTTDYELGTRFTAASDGEIVSLRYWRGAADSGDVDTRTLNLWNASGVLIASTTVVSGQGQSGWQVGVLSSAVEIDAGQTYTVSYGTTQNYALSQNYFGSGHTGPDGVLGTSTNAGVYSAGSTGLYPTQSYLASNYWVDVGFRAEPETNTAPTFTLASTALTAPEDQTAVATIRTPVC